MSRRSSAVSVCVVALVCTLTACGVGPESRPRAIEREDIPFGLAQRGRTTPTTTAPVGTESYQLYFVSGDRLRAVTRTARTALSPSAIVKALVKGPDESDIDAGLRTLLDPDVSIDRVTVDDGVATVRLGGGGAPNAATDHAALGIAQLVYTATAIPGVDRVRFDIDGQVAEVPRGDGTLSTRPVDRTDYPAVAP